MNVLIKKIFGLFLCFFSVISVASEIKFNPNAVSVDVIVPEHGMADAHALVKGDTLYVICGHDESWDGIGSFRMDRWEIWSTIDLKNWTYHRSIYPTQTYIGNKPNCWAGDICERNGKYYWFFSNRNIDTGVLEANAINGEYKDILGKPLLPKGIVPVHPYDPEIFWENGKYHICFGAGTYYMAELSEDMRSLKTPPQKIIVNDNSGKIVKVDDKSTLMKRNGWYYLIYGSKYAMSKDLYGPYQFKGNFLKGGHTSLFKWKNQWYVLQENHDISAFFRGISLKPVYFKDDNTIYVPTTDRMYPGPGRRWDFKLSTMGWKSLKNTTLVKGMDDVLKGTLIDSGAVIVSAPWLCTLSSECKSIKIRMKNLSMSNKLRISLFTRDKGKNFWTSFNSPVDWNAQEWITVNIKDNSVDYETYEINLSKFSNIKEYIMQVALMPLVDVEKGKWIIDYILID